MNREEKAGQSRLAQRITAVMFAVILAAAVMLTLLASHPALSATALVFLLGIFAGLCVAFYFLVIWVFQRPAELSKKLPLNSKEQRRKKQRFYDSLPK
jgi:hypothetical protein